MIRRCASNYFEQIYTIINDGAAVYKGVIPDDCWTQPYMTRDELQKDMDAGVVFWGWEDDGALRGVMGLQRVRDVVLIRHAYVSAERQRQGIGADLLLRLRSLADAPILVGTWADASWAIRFYQKNGFRLVNPAEKDRLLKQYWTVPKRQIEVSVVLADAAWRERGRKE